MIETRISTLVTSVQHCNRSPHQFNKTRKKKNTRPEDQKGLKLSLFTDGGIGCVLSKYKGINKQLELINEYQDQRILGGHAKSNCF